MIQPNAVPPSDGPFQPGSALVPTQHEISAEYHLNAGKTLYHSYLARSRQQDLDAAIQHFQKAVEMEPNLAEAYVQLASALWDQGAINLELAQFYCETALKLDPTQADANLYLGYFLQRAGFLEDASQQYDIAKRKNFWHSARARVALGHTLLKQSLTTQSKWQQAALATQGVLQFASGCLMLPFDRQTFALLSNALVTDAQVYTLQSLAAGLKKARLHDMACRIYLLGTTLLPKEPVFYQLLGDDLLFDQQKPEEAIEFYRQALLLEPRNVTLMKKLGRAYADCKDVLNAVSTLTEVIDTGVEDFETLYQLGQIHTEEKAYMKGLYYFKEAAKQRPNYPYVYSNMAYVLFKLDDLEGALEEYKRALDYGTDSVWLSTVSQTIGAIYCQVYQDNSQAMEYLQLSLHYNPENQDTLAMLADVYFETGEMELAISAYKTILQMDPDNADCYSNIGYILWQLDQNQAAIDAYMAAIHYDRNNAIAHNNLGVIYLDEEGNAGKALPLFQKALSLKPDYTLACFNTGRALQALGRTVEAAEQFSEALRLNQLNPELEDHEIQAHLDHLFDS